MLSGLQSSKDTAKKKGKEEKSQLSSLLHRWAALTEGSGSRARAAGGQGEGGGALVHIGSIPSKALVQTVFFFF